MNYPKSARVRKRKDYLNFFHRSDVKRLDSCILFRISNEKTEARLGVTVKSRTNSVFRNKIKRQIREAFRLNREKMKSFDYNVVIPANVKINFQTPKKVRSNLERLWANEVAF